MHEQHRFTVKEGKMKHDVIEKSKFAQINDKRFYFFDGIVSLPFSHPYLSKLSNFKEQKGRKIEKYILDEKQNLLVMENNTVLKSKKLSLLRNILLQTITYYHQDS